VLGESDPRLAEALHLLGKLLYALGNYLGTQVIAERIVRNRETLPPKERSLLPGAFTLLGSSLERRGFFAEAESAFRQALTRSGQSEGARKSLADNARSSSCLDL
jgi:Flp pilus assembly protein TadD